MNRPQTADSRPRILHHCARFFSVCCVLCAVCFLVSLPTAACPFCGEALFSSGDTTSRHGIFVGYLLSIVALISVPVLLVSGIAFLVVRATRRAPRTRTR